MYRDTYIPFIVIISIFFSVFAPLGTSLLRQNLEDFLYTQISDPLQNLTLARVYNQKEKPQLKAASVFSMKFYAHSEKERVMVKKRTRDSLPIASLTKLMTALVVMEEPLKQHYEFDRVLPVSAQAANQDNVPVYGNLKEGENFTVEKLLRLMLFYSSNDAAFALSEAVGTERFVRSMNHKAEALGMKNTHFINPSGLEPWDTSLPLNRSTSEDLLILCKYILKNHPLILRFSLEQGPYPRINGLSDLTLPEGYKMIGGKTGYTEKAGGCMMTIIEDRRGNQYLNIVLGASSPLTRVQEMQKLINWLNQ